LGEPQAHGESATDGRDALMLRAFRDGKRGREDFYLFGKRGVEKFLKKPKIIVAPRIVLSDGLQGELNETARI